MTGDLKDFGHHWEDHLVATNRRFHFPFVVWSDGAITDLRSIRFYIARAAPVGKRMCVKVSMGKFNRR